MLKDIEHLLKQKCSVGDCNEIQGMYISIHMSNELSQSFPFCTEHSKKVMELGWKNKENTRKIQKILDKSDGSMVRINSWHEFMRKLKPEFLQFATQGLELTKGLCVDCNKPALGIRTFLTPICGECYGFPKDILKCALK